MTDLNAFNLEPGARVGGYNLLSRLGGGAMGTVWRVKDDGGQIYAMKILRDSFAEADNAQPDSQEARERATARERFRREGLALQKIRHTGVCQIVDMELDDSLAFLVTEVVDGLSLRDDVKENGPYIGQDLARLAEKLIDAVDAVHAAGIIHRDIKPTNVMISARGPVLVDFGIAMGEGESHVTRTGLVMGTPGFIAPEIIEGAESDEATDWWSVASVIGFAAMGKPIYGAKPMMAVLEREAAGNANLAGLPPRTTYMLRQALDPDRLKRCSAQELLHAIQMDAASGAWDEAEGPVVPPFHSDAAKALKTSPRWLWTDPLPSLEDLEKEEKEGDDEEGDDTERKNEEDEPSDAQTAVLSSSALPGSTRIMPAQAWPRMTMHGDDEDTGDEDSTADCDDAGSETSDTSETGETEPLLTAPRIMPAAAPLGRTTPTTQVMPVNQAMPAMSQTQVMPPIPGQPLPFIPAAAANQTQAPDQPPVVPADSVLYWYRRHSLLPLILTTIPLTFFAMAAPLVTFFLAILLFWVFAAIGYNAQARERRREKKGNVFTKSDSAITGLAFPLRLLKAIPAALGAGVIMGIIWSAFLLLIVLLIGSAGGGSHVHATISLFSTTFSVPLPSGDLTSPETIALGLSFAFSWMCGLLSHTATMVRVGFGSTRTAKIPGYPRGEGLAPKTVAALFCLVALIFLTVSHCASGFLNWTPLPVSY